MIRKVLLVIFILFGQYIYSQEKSDISEFKSYVVKQLNSSKVFDNPVREENKTHKLFAYTFPENKLAIISVTNSYLECSDCGPSISLFVFKDEEFQREIAKSYLNFTKLEGKYNRELYEWDFKIFPILDDEYFLALTVEPTEEAYDFNSENLLVYFPENGKLERIGDIPITRRKVSNFEEIPVNGFSYTGNDDWKSEYTFFTTGKSVPKLVLKKSGIEEGKPITYSESYIFKKEKYILEK